MMMWDFIGVVLTHTFHVDQCVLGQYRYMTTRQCPLLVCESMLTLILATLLAAADSPFAQNQQWIGYYACGQGYTNLNITVVSPFYTSNSSFQAIFDFAVPSGCTGKFFLSGSYNNGTSVVVFTAGSWIANPCSYGAVGVSATYYSSNRTMRGVISNSGCSAAEVGLSTRKRPCNANASLQSLTKLICKVMTKSLSFSQSAPSRSGDSLTAPGSTTSSYTLIVQRPMRYSQSLLSHSVHSLTALATTTSSYSQPPPSQSADSLTALATSSQTILSPSQFSTTLLPSLVKRASVSSRLHSPPVRLSQSLTPTLTQSSTIRMRSRLLSSSETSSPSLLPTTASSVTATKTYLHHRTSSFRKHVVARRTSSFPSSSMTISNNISSPTIRGMTHTPSLVTYRCSLDVLPMGNDSAVLEGDGGVTLTMPYQSFAVGPLSVALRLCGFHRANSVENASFVSSNVLVPTTYAESFNSSSGVTQLLVIASNNSSLIRVAPYSTQRLTIHLQWRCNSWDIDPSTSNVDVVVTPMLELPSSSSAMALAATTALSLSTVSAGVTSPGMMSRLGTASDALKCFDDLPVDC